VSKSKKRKGGGAREEDDTAVDRVLGALERWPDGMHDLGEPTVDVPQRWPASVVDVYLTMDGARLFGDAIVLHPGKELPPADDDGMIQFGTLDDEPLWFDPKGRIWREDPDTGDRYIDGTALDRWLHGAIDATGMLFDVDGEFAEDAFTEDGELTSEIAIARARAQVKRDSKAPGPHWRLARLMTAEGELVQAREELEEVVTLDPTLAWAWLDLARISEKLGELTNAIDEARAASDANPGHEQRAYFLAEAARYASLANDEPQRAQLAAAALAASPDLVRGHLLGADDRLGEGEIDAAAHLASLAKALAPKDLSVLDLVRRVDAARTADEN
jgi:tetratricopeptide (TPR) repeat protein